MEKILSVIVPTYNMEKYLDRCLTSLIVEDSLMDDLEVIVVNDGSKDSSSQIAHSYEAKYPYTFIVVDKENGNYGSCVNKGIDIASGRYFRILDADDWFDNSSFSKYLLLLKNNQSDIVVTHYSTYYSDGMIEKSEYRHPKELYRLYNLFELDLFPSEWLGMHRVTFRTELLRQIGLRLQCGISYTDLEFCYFPMKEAQTVVFTDINLYQYCAFREGQTTSKSSRIKSLSHFEKVARRLVTDYVSSPSNKVMPYLRVPITSILHPFYCTAIVECDFSLEVVRSLRRIEKLVRSNAELYNMTLHFSENDFYFVAFWRRWGITKQFFLYKLYKKVRTA